MLSDIGSTVLNHRFGVYSSLNVENFTFKLKVLKKKTFVLVMKQRRQFNLFCPNLQGDQPVSTD